MIEELVDFIDLVLFEVICYYIWEVGVCSFECEIVLICWKVVCDVVKVGDGVGFIWVILVKVKKFLGV